MSRLARIVVMVIVLAASAAPAAHAAVRDLGPVANVSPLSAHGGWVLWSEQRQDGRWRMVSCGVPTGRRGVLEVGPPVMWQVAVDRSTAYSIRGPRPAPNTDDPPCTGSAAPCHLVAESLPAVPPTRPPLRR
jgi:hypothetical protein